LKKKNTEIKRKQDENSRRLKISCRHFKNRSTREKLLRERIFSFIFSFALKSERSEAILEEIHNQVAKEMSIDKVTSDEHKHFGDVTSIALYRDHLFSAGSDAKIKVISRREKISLCAEICEDSRVRRSGIRISTSSGN
jgi:hypothetical protein